jgi:integrase
MVTKGLDMTTNLDFQTVKNLKKPGRYTDALVKGLHLWVKSSQSKYWIFRYTLGGKQQNISLGSFPTVSIANARLKAQEARDLVRNGVNPMDEKKLYHEELAAQATRSITFAEFALATIETKRVEWSNKKHAAQWEYSLREYAFPIIGTKQLEAIDMEDILKILTPIWQTKTETATRLRGRLEWILAAATTRKLRTGMNPALWRGLLQTILPAPRRFQKVKHHKALPYKELPEFIVALRKLEGVAALALEFLILNANRSSEVTDALRTEVTGGVWLIPAGRMKARVEHKIPLCRRSLEILAIARSMDSDSVYLFSKNGKKLTNMAMPMTLRRAGLGVTVHGFRSTFRDWVSEETDHSPEVAEKALAHTIRNQVEAAYRRGDLFERRGKLMADWERFCGSAILIESLTVKAA